MFFNSGVTEKGIARILELSADAHIQRRQTTPGSPAHHKLTGMIAAYGKAIGLLNALHQREEFYFIISQAEQHTCLPPSLPYVE
jgi:hypothetical protein